MQDNMELAHTTLTFPELQPGNDIDAGSGLSCIACETDCQQCHNTCVTCIAKCDQNRC